MGRELSLTVYSTSKSDDGHLVTAYFESTTTRRCGRTKVIDISTGLEYWVKTEDWENINSVQEEVVEPVTSKSDIQIIAIDESPVEESIVHVVKRGETISSIACQYNVSESQIKAKNGTSIFGIGQRIRIS